MEPAYPDEAKPGTPEGAPAGPWQLRTGRESPVPIAVQATGRRRDRTGQAE